MKKVLSILIGFLTVCFLICYIIGFTVKAPVDNIGYRVLKSLDYFLTALPALMITGFIVGFATYFAQNYAGSALRFSKPMVDRYKTVVIVSLICTLILSLSVEVFGVAVKNKMKNIENRPALINEYIRVGNELYDNKMYERAGAYADAVLKLNKNSREAESLKIRANSAISQGYVEDFRDRLNESYAFETLDKVNIDSDSISEVYKYYQMANEFMENQEWFQAHYYAQQGLNLATPKDPNLDKLKIIVTDAWNNITELHKLDNRIEQLWYEQKFQGYKALMANDYLTSYYIFRNLHQGSKVMQQDPEVNFYLDVAARKIAEKAFFIDETFEIGSFESANDVYFAFEYKDGSKDIFYCKGISFVQDTGDAIQYLRGLTIESIDEKGNFYRSVSVPYAKVLPVSIKALNQVSREFMGIDEKTEHVPYIMLKSVSRDEGPVNLPEYVYGDGRVLTSPEYLIVPVPYKDFLLLEKATVNPDTIPLTDLFKMVSNISDYGFSKGLYGTSLMTRLLYPLFIFLLFIILGNLSWAMRVNSNQYFKFAWIFSFPIFIVVSYLIYRLFFSLYKIFNFSFYNLTENYVGMLLGGIFYVILFIAASIKFCANTTSN